MVFLQINLRECVAIKDSHTMPTKITNVQGEYCWKRDELHPKTPLVVGLKGVPWTKLGTKIVITSAGKINGSFGLIGLGKESFTDWRWNYTYLVEIALIISCRSVTFCINNLIAKLLLWKQKLANVCGSILWNVLI